MISIKPADAVKKAQFLVVENNPNIKKIKDLIEEAIIEKDPTKQQQYITINLDLNLVETYYLQNLGYGVNYNKGCTTVCWS